ncbi:hypothetical protein BU16DRAFT_451673 [Lophium mytilinum]|uniref:Tat pathway signal sequence n=1 Tax=Lophium mytilinum TaxID=390894 RepID=A0A6A6R9T1_9PEZI|nr:hypothetical protein BU16DRAFT_451673 [Lophium mytilinum]
MECIVGKRQPAEYITVLIQRVAPVHDAIRFHDVVYASGFRSQVTKFQGPPTVEVEQAWEELYPSTITRISAIEAAKLVNKTVRIPDDPENYLVSIDVFHQMHCLNIIRKKVWGVVPDTYVEEKMLELEHVDHCVDSIRQSLMCSGDVTPLPWKWGKNETDGTDLLHPEAHVVHTCRDWTSLIQWAKDRKVVKLTRNKRPVEEKRET